MSKILNNVIHSPADYTSVLLVVPVVSHQFQLILTLEQILMLFLNFKL